MTDVRKEKWLDRRFSEACFGKASCELPFEYDKVFDGLCLEELGRRWSGNELYGPAKVYALALCEEQEFEVNVLSFEVDR